jgi:outer membrane protein TolC
MSIRLGAWWCAVIAGLLCLGPAACTWTYQPVPAETYVGAPMPPSAPPTALEKAPAKPAEKTPPVKPPEKGPVKPPEPTPPETVPAGPKPVEVDVQEAVLTAMEHNQALVVQRLSPQIAHTFEGQAAGAFDHVAGGTVSNRRQNLVPQNPTNQLPPGAAEAAALYSNAVFGQLGLSQFLPTGTTVALSAATDSSYLGGDPELIQSRLGLSVTQSLLKGFGTDVNLATLRQARLDTLSSQYELRGFAESLVGQVEDTYWEYALALKQVDILKTALALSEKQLADTNSRIEVGKLAQTERAAAQAQVALRKSDLINGLSTLDQTRLQLLRLLNPQGGDLWKRDIAIRQMPGPPTDKLEDVDAHIGVALRMRPDLNQARLQIERGDLEVVKTKNGLLPQLDLFITLGKSGYANSFGGSWRRIDDSGYDIGLGVNASYPLENQSARAQFQRAMLGRTQSAEALDNLAQLVQVDVRSAYLEVRRAHEQIAATAASRQYAAETLTAEQEKFVVGRSTSLLVATAEQNLVSAQLAEVAAVVAESKAYTALYRLEGSLLERRGVLAPGREPVQAAIKAIPVGR